MTTLSLRPLPSFRSMEVSAAPESSEPGFVDEAVVMAMLAGPNASRERTSLPADLVLPADEMDFAGWSLSASPVVRDSEPAIFSSPAKPTARPSPPVLRDLGIGDSQQESHRWWLAGLAGAISTLLAMSLLIHFSSRSSPQTEDSFTIESPAGQPAPVSPGQTPPSPPSVHLTGASPDRSASAP